MISFASPSNIHNYLGDPATVDLANRELVTRRCFDFVVESMPPAIDRLAADRRLKPPTMFIEIDSKLGVEPMSGFAPID